MTRSDARHEASPGRGFPTAASQRHERRGRQAQANASDPAESSARLELNAGSVVEWALSLVSGECKAVLLYHLLGGTLHLDEIELRVPCCTPQMLTDQIRELELDGLITRQICPGLPPSVGYALTAKGRDLEKFLRELRCWAVAHLVASDAPKAGSGQESRRRASAGAACNGTVSRRHRGPGAQLAAGNPRADPE